MASLWIYCAHFRDLQQRGRGNTDAPSVTAVGEEGPDVADLDDDDFTGAQTDSFYVGAQVEAYVGTQVDVLQASMARKGGRKDVDPHMLKAHAESSQRLNKGNRVDEENPVGRFYF